MNLSIQLGPVGWHWQSYKEDCRHSEVFKTTYITAGIFHLFFSRRIHATSI